MEKEKNNILPNLRLEMWFYEDWDIVKYKRSRRSLECIPIWERCLKGESRGKSFLVNKGVEAEDIKSERFNGKEQLQLFIENKGELLACGTCMKNRLKEESIFCPIATMKDMLEVVVWSDKLVTFG